MPSRADSHKWLLGPEGAGIGYIRREWVERLHLIGVGANSMVQPYSYTTIDFNPKPHAGRWEGGAYNVPGIAAFSASLAFTTRCWDRCNSGPRAGANRLPSAKERPRAGWEVFSSRLPGEKSGIVSLIHPSLPQAK